jgi:hypothetical protein
MPLPSLGPFARPWGCSAAMRAPIFVFTGGLRAYPSAAAAERALAVGGPRALDAWDAAGAPVRLLPGRRGWFGLTQARAVRLEALPTGASERQQLRARLAEALVEQGTARAWAEGAPLGALVAEASRRFGG